MKFKRTNIFRNVVTALVLVLAMGFSFSFAEEQADNNLNYERSYSAKSISSIEDDLNDDYEKYKDGEEDLKFKYDLSESDDTITIKMDGENFTRTSDDWEKRDSDKFREFIKEIATKVAEEIENKVIKIEIEDEDNKDTAKYEYSFIVEVEYGEDDDSSEIEEDLNKKYDDYKDGKDDLEFEYTVTEEDKEVTVEMKGTNFKRTSTSWEKRDEDEFEDFVKEIAEDVAKETEKDVKVELDDKDGKKTGEYDYDESSKKFKVEYEFDEDDDSNKLAEELNDDFEKYKDGDYDLEFEYEVTEDSKKVTVEMKGTNFDRESSKWEKRNEKKFEDFVEDIAKKVADEENKDVEIELDDQDGNKTGVYDYDESKKDFEVEYEYEADEDDDDLADDLNDDFKEYTDGDYDLDFEYEVKDDSKEVTVEMKGTNFERDSSRWEKRNESKFKKFVEDIAEEVADKKKKDVKIELDDKDGKKTGEYEYDESKEDFSVEYEYSEDDKDELEEKLNDEYEVYEDGKKDLEFEYEVKSDSKKATLYMYGTNFDTKDSAWEDRDEKEFREFVEEVAEEVAKEKEKDVTVYVKDEDKETAAKYTYDESSKKLKVDQESGGTESLKDIEEHLEDEYEEYNDDKDLDFKYNLEEKSDYIKVEMMGQNFKKSSNAWTDRDVKEFRDFVEEIAKYVADKSNEDVTVYVKDEQKVSVAKYEYDESKDDFKKEYEK